MMTSAKLFLWEVVLVGMIYDIFRVEDFSFADLANISSSFILIYQNIQIFEILHNYSNNKIYLNTYLGVINSIFNRALTLEKYYAFLILVIMKG